MKKGDKAARAYEGHLLATAILPDFKQRSAEAHARFAAAVSRLLKDMVNPFAAAHLLRTYADAVESFGDQHEPRRAKRGRPPGSTDYSRDGLRARIKEIDELSQGELAPALRRFGLNNDTALASMIQAHPEVFPDIWRNSAKQGDYPRNLTRDALVKAIKRERAAMAKEKQTSGRLFGLANVRPPKPAGQK